MRHKAVKTRRSRRSFALAGAGTGQGPCATRLVELSTAQLLVPGPDLPINGDLVISDPLSGKGLLALANGFENLYAKLVRSPVYRRLPRPPRNPCSGGKCDAFERTTCRVSWMEVDSVKNGTAVVRLFRFDAPGGSSSMRLGLFLIRKKDDEHAIVRLKVTCGCR